MEKSLEEIKLTVNELLSQLHECKFCKFVQLKTDCKHNCSLSCKQVIIKGTTFSNCTAIERR